MAVGVPVSAAGTAVTATVATAVSVVAVAVAVVMATTGAVLATTGPWSVPTARLLTAARSRRATVSGTAASVRGPLIVRAGEVAVGSRTRAGTKAGTEAGAGTGAGTVAVSGARSAGRFGGWVRRMVCRGHRPIIARTTGALCSPRPNCR
ncbi:putative protein OS=Streptomyces aurantiogriseus OX=66870 GN=GCM10010251_04930 PE=4 SV=1 [Streptomyces aurantiogriseus]